MKIPTECEFEMDIESLPDLPTITPLSQNSPLNISLRAGEFRVFSYTINPIRYYYTLRFLVTRTGGLPLSCGTDCPAIFIGIGNLNSIDSYLPFWGQENYASGRISGESELSFNLSLAMQNVLTYSFVIHVLKANETQNLTLSLIDSFPNDPVVIPIEMGVEFQTNISTMLPGSKSIVYRLPYNSSMINVPGVELGIDIRNMSSISDPNNGFCTFNIRRSNYTLISQPVDCSGSSK